MSSHLKAPEGRKKSSIVEVSVAPSGACGDLDSLPRACALGYNSVAPPGLVAPICELLSLRDWGTAWAEAHPTFQGYSFFVLPDLFCVFGLATPLGNRWAIRVRSVGFRMACKHARIPKAKEDEHPCTSTSRKTAKL